MLMIRGHGLQAAQLLNMRNNYVAMDNIRYSRIRVIYMLHPCVVGFALRNVRYIFRRKMALVMFNIFVAYHNFKTTVKNYSVVRRILLITMFV